MQSMFRLVDLCYGIGLMFLLIALVLKRVKSVPWGIRVLINNVSMVLGLLIIIRCGYTPRYDRGWWQVVTAMSSVNLDVRV